MVRAQNGNSRRLRANSVFATSAGALLGPSYAPGLLALQCFPTVECRFKALHLCCRRRPGLGWAGPFIRRPYSMMSNSPHVPPAPARHKYSKRYQNLVGLRTFPKTPFGTNFIDIFNRPKNTLFLDSKNQNLINLHEQELFN